MDIVAALKSLRPGARWTLNGDTLDGLVWQDEAQSRPTDAEIETEASAQAARAHVPQSVKMWQAKAALAEAGKLQAANAVVAGANNAALTIAWEYAADLSRTSPGMAAVAQALGLSEAEVDQLFLTASQIQA